MSGRYYTDSFLCPVDIIQTGFLVSKIKYRKVPMSGRYNTDRFLCPADIMQTGSLVR